MVDFRTSDYFSGLFIFLALFLVLVGLLLMSFSIIPGLILLFVSVLIFTTHYRVTIDFQNHEFYDYLWILGFKRGEHGKFDTIEYLYIKKSKVSQRMNSRATSMTFLSEVYDGYLKFSEKDKIHLMTEENKDTLLRKMNGIANQLKVKIIDYSAE